MPEHRQDRYVSIPMDIFGQVDNPIDAIVYGYIQGWERSIKKSKVHLHAGCSKIAGDLKVSPDTITRSLKRLTDSALIRSKRTPNGVVFTTNTDVELNPQIAESLPQIAESESASCGMAIRKVRNVIPQVAETDSADCGLQINNPSYNPIRTPNQTPLPPKPTGQSQWDGGGLSGGTLPAVKPNLTIPQPLKRSIQPAVTLTPEMTARLEQATRGQARSIVDTLTPEMVTKGFLGALLTKLEKGLAEGWVKSPVGMLKKWIRDEWQDGQWVDPEYAEAVAATDKEWARLLRLYPDDYTVDDVGFCMEKLAKFRTIEERRLAWWIYAPRLYKKAPAGMKVEKILEWIKSPLDPRNPQEVFLNVS